MKAHNRVLEMSARKEENLNSSHVVEICPLYDFKISERFQRKIEKTLILDRDWERAEKGFEILDGVKIRKITVEELQRIKDFARYTFEPFPLLNERMFVIENTKYAEKTQKTVSKIDKVLWTLRLFKTGDISIKIVWEEKDGKVDNLGINDLQVPSVPFPLSPYILYFEEIEKVKEFALKIDNIDFDEKRYLRIAYGRFGRSCEEKREDDRIIDLMIAFEALLPHKKPFTECNKDSGIGRHIASSCSKLLGENERGCER